MKRRDGDRDTPVQTRSALDRRLMMYLDSRPPPPQLESAEERVVSRFREPSPSGLHDLEALKREQLVYALRELRQMSRVRSVARSTAAVVIVAIVICVGAPAFGLKVPAEVLGVIGAGTTVLAAVAPKLVGGPEDLDDVIRKLMKE